MGPTQMIVGPDGWLWVAQLNGEEDARQGQIVALPLDLTAGGQRRVLLSGLDKPTGITLLGDSLWIATRREIQRARLTPGGVARPEIIRVALPFNGRSGGTLTTSPNGRLLYETSGELVGNGAASGSGMLWELDPMSPLQSRSLARGLKNGYAHVFDEPGRLWVTEVAEDIVNDTVPADELNLLVWDNVPPARGEIIPDFGWPLCFADRQPALNYGADPVRCQTTRAPVAMFPPRSTPVSIVLSPWERDVLLVALWGPTDPAIVRIPIVMDGDNAKARSVEPFITGLQTPQHLFVLDSGQLLVSDHATGTVYRIRRQG